MVTRVTFSFAFHGSFRIYTKSVTCLFSVKNFESRKAIKEWSFLAKIRQMLTQFTRTSRKAKIRIYLYRPKKYLCLSN